MEVVVQNYVKDDEDYQSISVRHFVLFRIIGILPYVVEDEPNISRRRLKTWMSLVCFHSTIAIYYTMYLAYGIRMLLESRLEIDLICDLIVVQGVCLRHLLLYLRRDDLLKLTQICRELWISFVTNSEIERFIVQGYERKAYYLRQFFLISGFIAIAFYLAVAQIVRVPVINDDGNITYTRILPLKFYVDVQEEPWYTLATILQAIISILIAIILPGIETVGPFLIMMACGYLRSVRERLVSIEMYDEHYHDKLMLHELIVCVKFHQRTLEFCEKIDRFMRVLFMVQVSCTLYNMSLIGIKLLVSNDNVFKSISILLLNLAQFFSCQWVSQHLINESEAISIAAYAAVKFYQRSNIVTNRVLMLMMLRADRPVQLTAAGIIPLSFESFQKMIVNAFSAFTVLRTLTS